MATSTPMKKFFLSAAVIVSFIGYALRGQFGKAGQSNQPANLGANLNTADSNSQNTNTTGAVLDTNTTTVPPLNTNSAITTRKYTNGTYTGSVVDAFYGNVQVRVTISGGKLEDVQFLQYPNDRGHSVEVSQYSMPILRSEAIQAQSANVDIVSGATQTSEAFQQSLQAALSQA